MDIFKIVNGIGGSGVGEGEIVNGLETKMWIERYRQSGEFTLTASPDSDIRAKLPEGSLITHTDTREIMIVENHQLKEDEVTSEPVIAVTGRGLETFLEQRIIGANRAWPATSGASPVVFAMDAENAHIQAVNLINSYIRPDLLWDDDDAVSQLEALTDPYLVGFPGTAEARTFDRKDDVYGTVSKLLEVDDLGVKIMRERQLPTSQADFEATYKLKILDFPGANQWISFFWRCGDVSSIGSGGPRSSYALEVNVLTNQYRFVRRNSAGANTFLTSVSGTLDSLSLNGDTSWRFYRVQMVGNTMKARWWHNGMPEPTTWLIEAIDNTYTDGDIGIFSKSDATPGTSVRHRFDELLICTPPGIPVFQETWTGADYSPWSTTRWRDYLSASGDSTYTVQGNSGELRAGQSQIVASIGGLNHALIVVHRGLDRAKDVSFSYSAGDIKSAEYLWSIKKHKTSALVSGKWVEVMIHGPEVGYNRRTMFVDASDLDEAYSVAPTGTAWTLIANAMEVRGRQALSAQRMVSMSSVQINPDSSRNKYRKDYNVGDLVSVYGNYNASSVMRVTEHVEIEDERGNVSYPTLSAVEV